MKKSFITLSFMAAGSLCAAPDYWSGANGMEMARVADAGNAAYSSETSLYNGYGSVAYEYSIGKTEVTVSQYLNFVNSVRFRRVRGSRKFKKSSSQHVAGGSCNLLRI